MWTVMRDFRERKSTKAAEDKPAGALIKDLHKSQLGWVEEYWTVVVGRKALQSFAETP